MVIPADDIKKKIETEMETNVSSLESTIDSQLEGAAISGDWPIKIHSSEFPDNATSDEIYKKYEAAGYDVNRNSEYMDAPITF